MSALRPRSRALRALLFACIGVVLVLQSSCQSYRQRTEAAFADYERGQFAVAERQYADPKTTDSDFLRGAEAGMSALSGGNFAAARQHFEIAAEAVRQIERTALADPEQLGEQLLSWAVNDTWLTYEGEGYERALLHSARAIAHLMSGDLDGARVEVRQANALLESEERLYKKEYRAGGLGHFLSGLTYELAGRPDDAYIDYKRLEKKDLGRDLYAPALARLARELGNDEDLELWRQRYSVEAKDTKGLASIVVLAAVGSGPYKVETGITIPIPEGVVQWTVPAFTRRPQTSGPVQLLVEGVETPIETVVLEDVARVAKENLDDRLAWLATKSAVRAMLKYQLTRELGRDHGTLGTIAGVLFTVITERADLRCWMTLPDSWQASRLFLPAGAWPLSVRAGAQTQPLGRFELAPGETMFVFVRTLGSQTNAYHVGGRPKEAVKP
jgi:hypothetical protein